MGLRMGKITILLVLESAFSLLLNMAGQAASSKARTPKWFCAGWSILFSLRYYRLWFLKHLYGNPDLCYVV